MASSDPPADGHRVEDVLTRARLHASACAAAIEALAGARGRATSACGSVTAVVDGSGALTALALSDAATPQPAARIGPLIVETTRAARHAALARREAVLHGLLTDLGR